MSQQPERKPPPPKSTDPEQSRGGSGSQSANTGGQRGGRTTKVSPPTPRQQQQGGGANESDRAHSSKQQNRSSQLSPRPVRGGHRSNDSGGGRVSPRPANQRGQRSSKDNSASASATSRSGNEHYHQNDHFSASSMSEGGTTVSVIGEGRPSGDAKKKTTPLSSNPQQHQGTIHSNQTVLTLSASTSKSHNDQFSRAKGRRTTTQQQQDGSKNTLTTTAASNRKRSVSPSRGPTSSSKQNSQTAGGSRENGHHHHHNDRAVGNGYVKNSNNGSEGKRSRKGTEEDMDDDFLWDSSEETEILDTGGGDGDVGGLDGVGNGPVFMTDKPPKSASFRPVPQVGKALVNGGIGSIEGGRRVPVFEVWKDSDDEDIDDTNEGEEEESPLPVPWGQKGHQGQQQTLQRTVEIANVSEKVSVGVFEPSAPKVGVLQAPLSHPWERTQSACDLQEVNDHFTSLIRRVQSAYPARPLSTLTESEGSRSAVNISDENFNVFTMSSIWGGQSGLLSSKIELFDSDTDSKLCVDRINSTVKSHSSLHTCSTDLSDHQLEKQKKAQSFYSMLDALTEELPAATDKVQGEGNGDGVIKGANSLAEEKIGGKQKLLDEAIQSTQSSLTVQEAIDDELKYPLRSKLIEELLIENTSVRGKSKHTLQSVIESTSDVLETKVDIETLLPECLSESDLNRGTCSLPPPIEVDASFVDDNKLMKGAMVSFLTDFSFEQGCSLEAFTDKIFTEENLCPEKNLLRLQAAFQKIAQKTLVRQPLSFAMVGDVGRGNEAKNLKESGESTFEDPAIVSKVCLEGEPDRKHSPMSAPKFIKQSAPEKEKKTSLSISSPDQLEPLDVFPSAFDEGVATNFPLSAETAEKSQSTSREETVEPNSSPLQSQTPVNEVTEMGVDDGDIGGDSDGDGRGQEELTFEPLSAGTDKLADEAISAEDSALTLTTSEPSLEGYYLDWNTPSSCADNLTGSNWESDLLFLIECFPDLESVYLSTILKMCKGSLQGAISMILVSHSSQSVGPAEQSFMYFDSQMSTDTTDDASSSISSASYSELYSLTHGFSGQQLDSSPEQQTTTSRSNMADQEQGEQQKTIFTVGEENDDRSDIHEPKLVPYFDEPECANDEEIARALQEELDYEASSDQQLNKEATATSGGDHNLEIVQDQRDRSSSHGSKDAREPCPSTDDENLELKLSASLARQLQNMFGPITDRLPFEGIISLPFQCSYVYLNFCNNIMRLYLMFGCDHR